MDPEKASAWLKFLRELTATVIVFSFAIYAGYMGFTELRAWLPRIANAIENHVNETQGWVTNTEEIARLSRLQCTYLARMVKESPRDCELRNLRLGNTIIPN